MSAQLQTLPVRDILHRTFWIPAYQRGYRWTVRQVRDLLDDLDTFRTARARYAEEAVQRTRARDSGGSALRVFAPDPGDFYCLQPVVVSKRTLDDGTEALELIDGQQRLTTLHLLLRYLGAHDDEVPPPHTLRFETRTPAFLEALDPKTRWNEPDSFHLHGAYAEIQRWFADPNNGPGLKRRRLREAIENVLLKDGDGNTRFIWYELPDFTDLDRADRERVAAFIRLNDGKIRLTNAELIRALMLRADHFPPELVKTEQLQLTHRWDELERRLHHDPFWYFIAGAPPTSATRIDWLFRAFLQQASVQEQLQHWNITVDDSEFGTFRAFHDAFRHEAAAARGRGARSLLPTRWWKDLDTRAERLQEWFDDRVHYHLIGWWITAHMQADRTKRTDSTALMVDLLSWSTKQPHLAFEEALKTRIFNNLFPRAAKPGSREELQTFLTERLGALTYTSGGSAYLRRLLLLFNVATLLRNPTSRARFAFDLYIQQAWDIEHIHSVESSKPGNAVQRRRWLATSIEYWCGTRPTEGTAVEVSEGWSPEKPDLWSQATALWSAPAIDKGRFDALYAATLKAYGEDEARDVDHSLGNLTLLDQGTNRSYGNAVFPFKRKRILHLDQTATFVPLCTTHVFLKVYSRSGSQGMRWTTADAEAYQAAIVDGLAHFFAPGGHRPEARDA